MSSVMEPVHIGHLHRYYFDCNVWDLIASHPDCPEVRRYISRPEKRTIILSMLTAAEVLRIPDSAKRRTVCSTIASVLDPSHALIGPPMYVLNQAALAKRKGNPSSFSLPQEEQALRLRQRIQDPDGVSLEDRVKLSDWIKAQKTGFANFWKEVSERAGRDANLTVDA